MSKLTFKEIRERCEPMKHLLVSKIGDERLYLGFSRCGTLVTDATVSNYSCVWGEHEIENWTIKEYKPKRKLSFWEEYDKYDLNESVYLLEELRLQHPDLEIGVEG